MTTECTFCNDTKAEPGIPGPCVWCEEIGAAPSAPVVQRFSAVALRFATTAAKDYVSGDDFDRVTADRESLKTELSQCQDRRRQFCEAVNARITVLDDNADAAQSELAALREALEHIEKTCGQSRTVTRRLRWIAKRAELALAGRPYVAAEHELPVNAESEHFRQMRQNTDLRQRLAAAEQRNARQSQLLRQALNMLRGMHYEEFEAEVCAMLNNKPAESGASE